MSWKSLMDRSRLSTDKPMNRKERRRLKTLGKGATSAVIEEVLRMARVRTPEEEAKLEEIREREGKRF